MKVAGIDFGFERTAENQMPHTDGAVALVCRDAIVFDISL